jgi:membrane-bound lytic murein transglycosylase D
MKYMTAFLLPLLLSGCVLTEQNTTQQEISNAIISAHDGLACVASSEVDQELCEASNDGVLAVTHPAEPVEFDLNEETVPAPIQITDTWDRVRKGFTFAVPDKKRVTNQRNWYLRHPSYMERVSKRAEPFLYYIVEELEKAGMPTELALLPIVESAFDPFAYSHGRAAGMWQFIPSTGKSFDMKQTWWYDGRRDVIASTAGAIKYLQRLHDLFDGDWLHALAAYNSGEGRVMRSILKNKRLGKPTDFWSLDLPRETRAYVPKLLALADILANKESYAFEWPTISNQPVIEIVDVGSQIDLAVAAKKAGLTTRELHTLNPGYNRWATDPDGPHRLVVPRRLMDQFITALAETDKKDRLNWVRHEVKSGESLGLIADKYNTTIDVIQSINDMKNNVIYANDFLLVPIALKSMEEYSLSADQRLASTQAKKKGAYQLTHKIKSGDTFWDLSRSYKVSIRDLAKWNGMAPLDPLRPGRELVVWVNQVSEKQTKNSIMRTLTYTVRNGDSLSRIADKFNIKTSDITKWNSLNGERYLQPGQKLTLYVDVTRT